jgi:hypothetical protein
MMIRSWKTCIAACLMTATLVPAGWAQQGDEPAEAVAPVVTPDLAFDRYVDVNDLADAWGSMDTAMLCDLVLQLSEGERVLARPHQGIGPADKLLETLIRVAAAKRDMRTLARLEAQCRAQKKTALLELIANAKKLAAGGRAAGPISDADLANLPPEAAQAVKDLVAGIENASAAGDKAGLDALSASIAEIKELSAAQAAALKKMAATASEGLPAESNETVAMLSKLSAGSRFIPIKVTLTITNSTKLPITASSNYAGSRYIAPGKTAEIVGSVKFGQGSLMLYPQKGPPTRYPVSRTEKIKVVQKGPTLYVAK